MVKLTTVQRIRRSAGAWAAENLASGDFANIATSNAADGVYTLNGQSVAIGDIVDLAHPDTTFNPATDLDSGGIKSREVGGFPASNGFELAEPLLSQLLASGFTLVLETTTDEVGGGCGLQPHPSDWAVSVRAAFGIAGAGGTAIDTLPDGDTAFSSDTHVIATDATSKVALTVTDTRTALSINGQAVDAVSTALIGGTISNLALFVRPSEGSRLRSFAFYAPVDDADLPTLSAL